MRAENAEKLTPQGWACKHNNYYIASLLSEAKSKELSEGDAKILQALQSAGKKRKGFAEEESEKGPDDQKSKTHTAFVNKVEREGAAGGPAGGPAGGRGI